MHLRFTIRDLLWLAVVVGIAAGWWLHSRSFVGTRDSERLEYEGKDTKLAVDQPDYKTIAERTKQLEERQAADSDAIKSLQKQCAALTASATAASTSSATTPSTTTPSTTPNLEIEIAGPQTAKLADDISFDVTVTNRGTTAATGLTVSDRFDLGLQHFNSQTNKNDTSPIRPERPLGDLQPGESKIFALKFRVSQSGNLCHTVEVRGPDDFSVSKPAS